MYKITEPTAHTALATIQPTTRLAEIRHGAEFRIYRSRSVPATIQRVARSLRILLVLEPRIHIPDQMIVVVIAHHHLLDLAVLAHLAPKVLVEGVKVVLQLRCVHLGRVGRGVVRRVLVQVRQQDGLAVRGLDVFAGTSVAVPAGADFVVETAVDFVLFCAEDGCQVVGHAGGGKLSSTVDCVDRVVLESILR